MVPQTFVASFLWNFIGFVELRLDKNLFEFSVSWFQAQPSSMSAAVLQHHSATRPHPLPQQLRRSEPLLWGGSALPAPPTGRSPPDCSAGYAHVGFLFNNTVNPWYGWSHLGLMMSFVARCSHEPVQIYEVKMLSEKLPGIFAMLLPTVRSVWSGSEWAEEALDRNEPSPLPGGGASYVWPL